MLPVDDLGRIFVSNLSVVNNNRGIGYAADGSMVITPNLTTFDAWVAAWRLDPVGRVCYAPAGGAVVYNAGLPFLSATGQLVATLDAVPGVNDPYVAGAKVSATTGAYFTTAPPPGFINPQAGNFLTDEFLNPLTDELNNELTG